MSKMIDLRCGRRISLVEGRLLLALLADQDTRVAKSVRRKLEEAVKRADHKCIYRPMKGWTGHGTKTYRYCITCGKGEHHVNRTPPPPRKKEPLAPGVIGKIG